MVKNDTQNDPQNLQQAPKTSDWWVNTGCINISDQTFPFKNQSSYKILQWHSGPMGIVGTSGSRVPDWVLRSSYSLHWLFMVFLSSHRLPLGSLAFIFPSTNNMIVDGLAKIL